MSVRTLLDDAAAEATAELRIDLFAARRRADERRTLRHRRVRAAVASTLAVAAVVTLIAVLLPGAVFRAVAPARPVDGPTGLPDHWYYAPPWTPPVTRHPMPAASMVLASPLQLGWSSGRYDGPILVSADGTRYASVPWGRWDSMVALAHTGRDVAWISQGDGTKGGPERASIHRIHLSDGHRRDVQLPAGMGVDRLLWEGDQLFVIARDRIGGTKRRLVLAAGSDVLTPATDTPELILEPSESGLLDEGDADHPGGGAITVIFGPREPGGDGVAKVAMAETKGIVIQAFSLLITRGSEVKSIPITGADPITDVAVLGWAPGGVVVRVHSQDRLLGNRSVSLRLFAPDGTSNRIVSRRSSALIYPVAVAADVVGAGTIVPGVEPTFAEWDRSHLQYLGVQVWTAWRGFWIALLAGMAGLVVLVVVLRLRSRRRRLASSIE